MAKYVTLRNAYGETLDVRLGGDSFEYVMSVVDDMLRENGKRFICASLIGEELLVRVE